MLRMSSSCLLVVDMQNDFCTKGGHFDRNGKDVSAISSIVPRIGEFADDARRLGIPVQFAQQTTLAGLASDTPAWLQFKTRDGKSPDYTIDGTWGHQIVDAIPVMPDEVVTRKFRPSAFFRTDLDDQLRAREIETVVIAGCITQGCVQATATDASYHDYYVIVAEDRVQSTNPELHENALRFLRSRYEVVPAADVVAAWATRAAESKSAAGATAR
jgi:nicotinamidase-related amidase